MSLRWVHLAFLAAGIVAVSLVFVTKEGKPLPESSQRSAKAKGKRLFGIATSEAKGEDYAKAVEATRNAGGQFVTLSFNWSDLETAPGKYVDTLPDIANLYYPAAKLPVLLIVRPIDTVRKQVPADLKETPFDSPEMSARFNQWMTHLLERMAKVDLIGVGIGNEVDIYLGENAALWKRYQTFYETTRRHLKRKRPKLPVGVVTTFGGNVHDPQQRAKALNAQSDMAMLTYYGLKPDFTVQEPSQIRKDFDALAKLYAPQPLWMIEAGYPSGEACSSSEAQQAEFVKEMFAAWDAHAARMPLLCFSWLTDVSPQSVEEFTKYYGLATPAFREYLRTLGLRHHDGKEKAGYLATKREAKARGW